MERDETQLCREVLEHVSDGVYFLDPQRRITYWNDGAARITGYPAAEVLGSHCQDNLLNHISEAGEALCTEQSCPACRTLREGAAVEACVYMKHRDGHRIPLQVRSLPLRSGAGELVGAVEVFRELVDRDDLTRRLQELETLALLDPLTGIGNRRYGEMSLQAHFGELRRYGRPFGVLFADIDRFKALNDSAGHAVGDAVLRNVARTLADNVRSSDQVVRWGGEEFLLLLAHADRGSLAAAGEKLRVLVRGTATRIDGASHTVSISLGGTVARTGDTVHTLIRRADRLMYRSKTDGRDRYTGEAAFPNGAEL
jgi:diguanylate cyclase (GGDEF)-like protein/PAS domain S-box-containing protein